MLTLNAMVAAQSVLVPLQCEFFALEGLSQLTQTIEQVRHSLNPALDIQGIVLTMYDLRNNLSGQVEADVRGHFGALVYQSVIRAMSVFRRRRHSASRRCYMITNAAAVWLI